MKTPKTSPKPRQRNRADLIKQIERLERETATGRLIQKHFKPFGKSKPHQWPQRTFLERIGKLYEKNLKEASATPQNLLKMIKTIGDQCKNNVQPGPNPAKPCPAEPNPAISSPNSDDFDQTLHKVLRDVYDLDPPAPSHLPHESTGHSAAPATASIESSGGTSM